jgi:hypothetical protein
MRCAKYGPEPTPEPNNLCAERITIREIDVSVTARRKSALASISLIQGSTLGRPNQPK